jgi:hypothetical protein
VRNLKILHAYGFLGKLDWLKEEGALPFGAVEGNIAEISSRIQTFTEGREDPARVQIRNAIEQAEVFIVVGFGFHRQNTKLLTSTAAFRGSPAFMTVYGIRDANFKTPKDRDEKSIAFWRGARNLHRDRKRHV